MNKVQYAGIIISSLGSFIILFWILWKVIEYLDVPDILKIGIMLLFGGVIITIASLVRERSQDVKKETYFK
ncbi:MAG TPA: hypothetical protein PK718_08395 [Candidatus Methanofastidiosa archaeon]|nr:hypothetical protein [Candidatus Methanofastidiosa archaeon]